MLHLATNNNDSIVEPEHANGWLYAKFSCLRKSQECMHAGMPIV